MNKIQFTNRYFYLALAATLFIVLFYQSIAATITGNPFGYIPAVVALLLIVLMALKHEYTQMVLNIWAGIFMILAYGIKIVFKFVTQSGNLEGGFDVSTIYLNGTFMALGILALFGGRYFIVKTKQSDK